MYKQKENPLIYFKGFSSFRYFVFSNFLFYNALRNVYKNELEDAEIYSMTLSNNRNVF